MSMQCQYEQQEMQILQNEIQDMQTEEVQEMALHTPAYIQIKSRT